MSRRFPPPWTAEETDASVIVRDNNAQASLLQRCPFFGPPLLFPPFQ
jgi:hypothetical protein